MPRGRTPSNSDDQAIAAVAGVRAFLRRSGQSATALARQIKASPSSVLRALKTDPPAWTPTLTALDNFVKSQVPAAASSGNALEDQLRTLRGTGSASATAAVLRAVADLLELDAAR
jgi:glutamine synthetase adenylyltransferase